jgi:3'-phosphoadenosine 5'-phosphosulfate sulfotransferase (PAPS reductase)/FAD synthetase
MVVDIEERRKELDFLKAEPLNMKIQGTIAKVIDFWQRTEGNCYLSYSGGADSTVLKDIIETKVEPFLKCEIKKVFDDTGLEEPSVRAMAINDKDIIVVKPKKSFYQVLSEVGYPVISKEVSECVNNARRYFDNLSTLRERERVNRNTTPTTKSCLALASMPQRVQKLMGLLKKRSSPSERSLFNKTKYKPLINAPFRISNECCSIMKKRPMGELKGYPIIATMTEESKLREQAWLKNGCNSFEGKIMSKPISPWTKQDILQYIKENNLKIADCYGQVVAIDKDGIPTFDDLKDRYAFSGVQRTGCIFCMFSAQLDTQKGGISRFEHLRLTQPQLFDYCMRGGKFDEQGLWVPDKGLGLAFVIEWLNRTLSKKLKNGKTSLFIKGVDLSAYKQQVDGAFVELERLEPTRKKWYLDEL